MSHVDLVKAAKEGNMDEVKQACKNDQNLEAKDGVSLRACGSDDV